jgi:hypothetical protein
MAAIAETVQGRISPGRTGKTEKTCWKLEIELWTDV